MPAVQWALGPQANPAGLVVFGVNHTQWTRIDNEFGSYGSEVPVHAAGVIPLGGNRFAKASFLAVEAPRPDAPPWAQPNGPMPRSSFQLWSDLLDSGIQIAVAGGSDNRCIQQQIGTVRTRYLASSSTPKYSEYLAALRWGRTVLVEGVRTDPNCTDGTCDDWLDLEVEWQSGVSPSGSAVIGDAYTADNENDVHDFHVTGNLLEAGKVQLLWNGNIVREWDAPIGPVSFHYTRDLEDVPSGWVTVRSAHVQTSPIYVLVEGRPIHDPWPTSIPSMRPDPGAPCRMAARVQELMEVQAGNPPTVPPAVPSAVMRIYNDALKKYKERAVNCDPNNPPSAPAPGPPPDDEAAVGDFADFFPGQLLNLSESTQRVTGRIVPANDEDHFVIQAQCPAQGELGFLRARVALRTEAKTDLVEYRLDHCWSDNLPAHLPPVECRITPEPPKPPVVSSRFALTGEGGGTTDNVALDAKCLTHGQPFFLNIIVFGTDPFMGDDVYSLFHSIEWVKDGFLYANGSGAGEFPAGGTPTNP